MTSEDTTEPWDEAKALFRKLVEDARAGDEESRAVLDDRVRLYADDPDWAELVAQARQVLATEPRPPHPGWRRRWEPEGLQAAGKGRTYAALFVVALMLAAVLIWG